MDNLDRVNAIADASPGFIWRLTGEGDNATDIKMFDDPLMILNISVWRDLDSLTAFVYRTAHRDIMRRRAQWFEAMPNFMALWWVPVGHLPPPEEGLARLDCLGRVGASAEAFTFKEAPVFAGGAGSLAPARVSA